MLRGTIIRSSIVAVLLAVGFAFIWRARLDATRATLLVTAVICGVTTIYALITYEILLQNRAMARAATDSTRVMERSLRFSYAPNLLYRTLNTKDPKFEKRKGFSPIENEDYQRALRDYTGPGDQKEFVFGVVENVGRGPAKNLIIDTQYNVWDTSNPNKNYSVKRAASVQILGPGETVALFIYVSKLPTGDDRVELVSASLTTSDFYRDALGEPAQKMAVELNNHHSESEPGCIVRIA